MNKHDILKILTEHKDTFQKKYGVTAFGIFGSYAKDCASEESDIDIFAEMPPKFDLLVRFEEDLETLLNHKIDLIRLRKNMNPRLKENILKDGLYA